MVHLMCSIIVYRFGLHEFFVLETNEAEDEYVVDQNFGRQLLSSIVLAMNNTKLYMSLLANTKIFSCIPCFVRVGEPMQNLYIGQWQTKKELVRFRSECTTSEIPPLYTHLSGLLDLYSLSLGKSAIQRNTQVHSRFTYVVNPYHEDEDAEFVWRNTINACNDKSPLYLMDYGTEVDPMESLHISCSWPTFSESSLATIQADLQIEDATSWSIQMNRYKEYVEFAVLFTGICSAKGQLAIHLEKFVKKYFASQQVKEHPKCKLLFTRYHFC